MHENAFFNKSIVLVMGGGVGLSNFGFLVCIELPQETLENHEKTTNK